MFAVASCATATAGHTPATTADDNSVYIASRTNIQRPASSKRVNPVLLTSDTIRSITRVSSFRATRRYDTRSRATDDRPYHDDP